MHYVSTIHGHVFWPGRARKKPESKNCGPCPTRPDSRAAFSQPRPGPLSQNIIGLSGHRAGSSLNLPNLLPRLRFLYLGPARRAKLRGRAGPFSGRAELGRRAGLPMLRFG
jgi:hypothetical protein